MRRTRRTRRMRRMCRTRRMRRMRRTRRRIRRALLSAPRSPSVCSDLFVCLFPFLFPPLSFCLPFLEMVYQGQETYKNFVSFTLSPFFSC